jgi:hypothetical protein
MDREIYFARLGSDDGVNSGSHAQPALEKNHSSGVTQSPAFTGLLLIYALALWK